MKKPGGLVFMAERPEYFRELQFGGMNEALLFAGSDGRGDLRAIGVDDSVAGILPALVLGAVRGARLVVVEAIFAHGVAVEPLQGFERGIERGSNEVLISRPVPQERNGHGVKS